MRNIKYDIKTHEDGKPYINLKERNLELEDRFFVFELVRYSLFKMVKDSDGFPDSFIEELSSAGQIIGEISDRFGDMIQERDDALGDLLNDEEE